MKSYVAFGACFCAALIAPANAKDGVKVDHRGVSLEAGPLDLNLGGRLHVDAARFDDMLGNKTTDVAVRRARLEFSGRVANVVRFRVDQEFAGNSKGWRNVWLSAEPVKNVEIKGGNFIVPFSGEDLQSSNTMPFMERSLATALTPGFGLGGAVSAHGKHWSVSGGYFTDALDNDENRSIERGKGIVARVTFAPINRGGRILHFAGAGERRSFSTTEQLAFSADAGSVLAPRLMSSGTIGDLDQLTAWNGEVALANGPLLVQAHGNRVSLERGQSSDLSFNGQTVQASWVVLGAKRYEYSEGQGVFNGPALRKGKGAVEFAARVSRLDLSDGMVQRGVGRAITGGANWYINRNLRLMANYTNSRIRLVDGSRSERNDVGALRLQVAF
ncbi:OprO/OprP family phosphate-selective porin [Sphingomonas sp. GCM10030256]|uniref:OprO/OprP family phosphate-selective porin n=1 Tax=Sphingomonas sp. GCM10030256 TaxID=3273427 RepID=UPI003608AC21